MPASSITTPLRFLYYQVTLILLRGNRVHCPICDISLRRFINVSRERATALGNLCPKCRSFERHRLLWLFLRDRTDLFQSTAARTMLHIAPEPCLKTKFEGIKNLSYKISDLRSTNADRKIDVTDICLSHDTVDIIICNHVLEHVPDDRKAMRELRRVLKSGGWAVINVPVDYARELTYEDNEITTAGQRKDHFGQSDHVRVYGLDYTCRLTEAGFDVKPVDYSRELGRELTDRYVLSTDEIIYFCT